MSNFPSKATPRFPIDQRIGRSSHVFQRLLAHLALQPNKTRRFATLALRSMAIVALLAMIGGLGACATAQSREVFHGLHFDAFADGQNIEILAHRYGSKENPIIINPTPADIAFGPRQRQGSSGGYRIGDELYVKWRDKATNKVYEETFILKGKLPVDMNGVRITFLIRENRMVVYVVLDAARLRTEPYDGPSIFQHSRVLKLN